MNTHGSFLEGSVMVFSHKERSRNVLYGTTLRVHYNGHYHSLHREKSRMDTMNECDYNDESEYNTEPEYNTEHDSGNESESKNESDSKTESESKQCTKLILATATVSSFPQKGKRLLTLTDRQSTLSNRLPNT